LVHGIADEHQRLVARSRAVSRDQVAHGVVANVGKAHAAQARLDRRGDERLEQRLVLEQRGLWARYLDERDQEVLRLLAGDARLQQRLDLGVVHRRAPGGSGRNGNRLTVETACMAVLAAASEHMQYRCDRNCAMRPTQAASRGRGGSAKVNFNERCMRRHAARRRGSLQRRGLTA